MPRVARIKSSTGIYHLITSSINPQNLSSCADDYERFLNTLTRHCPKSTRDYLLKLATLSNAIPETQKKVLNYLKGLNGCFLRQLARLTGLTLQQIVRA